MRRYEDGYSPEPQESKKPGEGVTHERSTIKIELKIPIALYKAVEECLIKQGHKTVSKRIISRHVEKYIYIGVRVEDLLSRPGKTFFVRSPDGTEEPIDFVL